MSQDIPRRPSQQGFHNTFGQGRSIKRDSVHGDSQRPTGDVASTFKRTLTVDRRDERSPATQHDRLEGSSPTATVSHRQRHPDNPKPHASSLSSKAFAGHVPGISLKPVLDLISERMAWFRARNEAVKSHKRAMINQEQNHYRPSDYASSQELLVNQQKQNLDDIRKAEKNLVDFDDRIASAVQPLLQHIAEAWGKGTDPSKSSEEQAASDDKINTIQNTIKKEMEESFKKEATESHQLIKELVGSQIAKLKEALAQENEQKLHSLQKTLAQEGEDRATSLRKTLIQENEKRVAEMKDSINCEHKGRIAALEKKLSEVAKNRDRIAALEKVLADEANNKDRIAKLERDIANNKDRIVELEKVLADEAKNKDRIAELQNTLSGEKGKITGLNKRVARLEARLDRAAADQQLLVESLIDKTQLTALDDKMVKLEARFQRTLLEQRQLSESLIDKPQLAQELQQLSLSQDEKTRRLEARLNLLPDHSARIEDLAGQLNDHSKLIKEKTQQQDEAVVRLGSLESSCLARGKEIKERVQLLGSNHKPAPASEEKILEVIKPELAKNSKNTKEMVMQIQSKLRPFLEKERHQRETLEDQMADVTRQISELQKETATTKTEYSELAETLNGQSRDEARQLEERLNARLSLRVDEFRSRMNGVSMQVQSLNEWQIHFNTRGLYRDILSHISKALPEGTGAVQQIRLLKQQMSGIETRMAAWENHASNKRRKLPCGNSRAVNGHQTDA
ncbi:hypothetical protein V8C42DRAFT_326730 [Trichoderma barbatum]